MRLYSLLPSIFICMSSQAYAEENHQAHIHGEAEMTIILQDTELAISFKSPSANIVGFEHQPETDQQRDAINKALVSIQTPANWMQFDGGNCELQLSEADTNLESGHSDDEHENHSGGEHENHSDGEHENHSDGGHTEFTAQYLYDCQKPSNLESISITLQTIYPAIEHIEVQWIINGNQGITELETNNIQISFK